MEFYKHFYIGKYHYISNSVVRHYVMRNISPARLDIHDSIKSYDNVLHQSLDKIFRERCSGSSDQIKGFVRGLKHDVQSQLVIKPILEQECTLSEYFSKEELGKLSLLWISVLVGYTNSAELLVLSGADVNEYFGRHEPQVVGEEATILHLLLHMHSSPENQQLIRLVIDHGADLQTRYHMGKTVLHHAVQPLFGDLESSWTGQVQIIEMLIEKGADVNATDTDGQTPLLIAVNDKKANILVPLLVKHGANIFAQDRSGANALHHLTNYYFMEDEHAVELARFFIEKGGLHLEYGTNERNQPIHEAAKNGNNTFVKLFLDHGANVNVQNRKGESPLHLAAHAISEYCHCNDALMEVMETLFKRGANINLRAINGRTALHVACEKLRLIRMADLRKEQRKCITTIIKLLLFAGADVLAQDSEGNTPLALISSGQNVKPPGTRLLIKSLALKTALQPSIELMDVTIIEHPTLWDYYQDCIEEINKMKSTRFIHTCTFFELFSKSHCQIAALMRNPEFETKFREYDLSGFRTYAEYIRRAFDRAQDHYQPMLKQENVINEAVYNILPDLVVEKVVHYIFNCCKISQNM